MSTIQRISPRLLPVSSAAPIPITATDGFRIDLPAPTTVDAITIRLAAKHFRLTASVLNAKTGHPAIVLTAEIVLSLLDERLNQQLV
jgi:hypothetical protein